MISLSEQLNVIAFALLVDGWRGTEVAPLDEAAARLREAGLDGPGLPTTWTRVLERNPEAMNPEPLRDHVWLATPGKVLHVDERVLESTDDLSSG